MIWTNLDFLYIEDIQICPLALLARVKAPPYGLRGFALPYRARNETYGFIATLGAACNYVKETRLQPAPCFGFRLVSLT